MRGTTILGFRVLKRVLKQVLRHTHTHTHTHVQETQFKGITIYNLVLQGNAGFNYPNRRCFLFCYMPLIQSHDSKFGRYKIGIMLRSRRENGSYSELQVENVANISELRLVNSNNIQHDGLHS